jgi:hypothetical protein
MRDRVGTDLHAAICVTAELVPRHRGELRGIVGCKLRDQERGTAACIAGADEELDRDSELLQLGKDAGGTPKPIVEGRCHLPETAQDANLSQKKIWINREAVLPRGRDGVVAEDEGQTSAARHLTRMRQPA